MTAQGATAKFNLAARAEQPITKVPGKHCFDRIRLESLKAVVPERTISDMIESLSFAVKYKESRYSLS